uniref:B30.2/SPRY domain-containing protein n=1 Tax=Anas platyrhynchos platyrhynchos TaxID=8840 RepID=A0A493T6G4_ANAPP
FVEKQAAELGKSPGAQAQGQHQGDVQGRVGSWDRAAQGWPLTLPTPTGHQPWTVTSSPLSFQHGEGVCCLKIEVRVHWVALCGAPPVPGGACSGAPSPPHGAAPGPELGKACPGLSSAPDGLAPSVPAEKVTLDPDTAHPQLVVSPDNKSVRRQTEPQQVPDTLRRFDSWCCVLGREDFREGRHCWLVEVEGEQIKDSWWAVGVARASVERKGWIDASPKEGIWAVRYYERQLMPLTWPNTRLSLSPVPTRIWVCLDCTQQQVSFINADNGVQIFTFTAASFNGESIRPWFWLVSNSLQLFLRDSNPQTPSPALG